MTESHLEFDTGRHGEDNKLQVAYFFGLPEDEIQIVVVRGSDRSIVDFLVSAVNIA